MIVGDDEVARGVAAVKSLRTGAAQQEWTWDELPRRLAALAGRGIRKRTMVDEYLSEREQADQLRRWLRENWIWLVAGVALTLGRLLRLPLVGVAAGVARGRGRRSASRRCSKRSARAGATDGVKIAGELTGEYADTPYADQATLVLARWTSMRGDLAAAEAKLARVADGSKDPDLRTVARLRLARVQLAQGRYDDALATLDTVATPAVDARVLELKGDVQLAQGDQAGALDQWRKAEAAAEADPASAGPGRCGTSAAQDRRTERGRAAE